jgi:hypothetical protein
VVFHEKLLEATTIKSLTAGNNVTLVSTGEFVSISAEGGGATSADGPAGTIPLVNAEGEILRIRQQGGLGSVEVGVQLQAAQFQAPFAVMDQTNATALHARISETRAECITPVEVNGSLSVSGTDVGAALGGKQDALEQPGFGTRLLFDGNRLERVTFGAGISGGIDLQHDGTQNMSLRVSVKGRVASQVTCQDNLTVTGLLVCQDGMTVAQGVAAQSIFCQRNLSVLGNIVGRSPYYCAGRVNGATLAAVSSIGRVAYTVSRPASQATGVYVVTFASPAPSNNYVITLANMNFGTIYLWDLNPPTVNGFHCVVVNNAWSLRDAVFHFSVTL